MKWFFLAVVSIALLSGCGYGDITTHVMPSQTFREFKAAYVEPVKEDEFNMTSAIKDELSDMGFMLVDEPFETPSDMDMLVKFSYHSGWDTVKYLQSFQIQFISAKMDSVIATSSFTSTGLWFGTRDYRLYSAFKELREKLGYPPRAEFK